MFLEPTLANILMDHKNGDIPPERIFDIHESFYEELVKLKFIVDDEYDEMSHYIKASNLINGTKFWYRLIINPTLNCNFSCWYCYEDHSKHTRMSDEILNRIKLLIENICSDPALAKFQLSYFGGEPLLYYKDVILPIAKYSKEITTKKGIRLGIDITTNGYLVSDKVIEDLSSLGLESFQISFDGNKQSHDKTRYISKTKGSYDIIVSNIKKIIDSGFIVVLRINYTQDNLVGLEALLDSFEDIEKDARNRIIISLHKVWQETNENLGARVIEFQREAYRRGFRLPDSLEADNVRNSCYADKDNEAVINYNGDIYKCNARDFTEENKEGYLDATGNIVWNERHEKRIMNRHLNKPCTECSILPICGGGCSQLPLDYKGESYCINKFSDKMKHDKVISMFLSETTMRNEEL
jgi:uncharacterized protein